MSVDGWIRRAALLAIPAIAIGLYFARERAPEPSPAPAEVTSAEATGFGIAPSPGSKLAQAVSERGEAALGAPAPKPSAPLPVATSAADLPLATTPQRRHHAQPSTPARRSNAPVSACGGVEVRLITASDDPQWAFASLSPALGEDATIKRVGESIGGWRVDKIEWDRVWLRGASGRCAVGMHYGAREAEDSLPNGKRVYLAPESPDEAPWRVPGEIANSIDKLGETEFSVEKVMVPAIFDRAGALLSGLHIEPVKNGEEVVGLELGEIRTDSLLERLGVETGDVVLAIDDEPVKDLEALVRVLGGVRENERLVAKLQRNGEAFELRVVTR
jgi:hypothetical protein